MKRVRHRLRLVGLALAVLTAGAANLSGCRGGGETVRPWEVDLERLRREAAEDPQDAEAQRGLAEAELLGHGGDPRRARAVLERGRALRPDDPELALLSALERDLHGDPDAALGAHLDTVRALASRAATADDGAREPWTPREEAMAELALGSIGSLESEAPGYPERVGPVVAEVTAAPGRLPFAASQAAGDLAVRLALRAGEPERAQGIAAAQGCVTSWRIAGPFGPRSLLGWDRPPPAQATAQEDERLQEAYELGPNRGRQPTRTHQARGCVVHLGDEGLPFGGTTLAEGTFRITEPGPHLLRLETPNAVVVEVDGERVLSANRLRETGPALHYLRLDGLAPGEHRIRARITTRHPNPVLLAAVGPARGSAGAYPDPPRRPLDLALQAATAFARGDAVAAREALRPAVADQAASPILLSLAASVALGDPLRPSDLRRDDARQALRAARRDPDAWFPVFQDARLRAAEGQDLEAIGLLREARERWPERPAIALTLADLLLGRGWDAEAREVVEAARRAVPDACPVVAMALDVERRRDRIDAVDELTRALVACDGQSEARYRQLLAARRWDEAEAELDRLAGFTPPQKRIDLARARLRLARARGDEDAAAALEAELRGLAPYDSSYVQAKADRSLAEGERGQALRTLTRAIDEAPHRMAPLHQVRRALGHEDELDAYRHDTGAVLDAYRSSGRSYDAPDVLVLDTMVTRVYRDGSSRSIVHQIFAVQSEEAVDEHGEFSPPGGADLLNLRTIKADGTYLEPDAIAGKSTISLPNLAVGDFVEVEYLDADGPSETFPDGWLGPRFSFQSFETPFDRSELTLILPASLGEVVVDTRGDAPTMERETTEDGLQVLRWSVVGSEPLTPEPLSVAAREYVPSVVAGVRADWETYLDSLRDLLMDRDVVDPAAVRLVAEILGEDAATTSPRQRAEAIYGWVLDEIEATDDAFGLAPGMLAARTGHRARVLHYLLGLAGVPSELVLARTIGADQLPSTLAEGDSFVHLLVALPGSAGSGEPAAPTGPVYLQTDSRWAPFGYLPPFFRGQPALPLTAGGDRVQLPEDGFPPDRRSVAVQLTLASDGSARGEVAERYRGFTAVQQRDSLESVPAAVLEQRFEEAYLSQVVRGARLTSLTVNGDRTREGPVDVRYGFQVERLGRQVGDRLRVPGLFPAGLAPVWAAAADRSTTELIPVPIDAEVELRITPPPGRPVPDPRPPIRLDGPQGARFTMDERVEDGALVVRRTVLLPVMRVPPDRYEALAAFCRAVDQAESREVAVRLGTP